MSTNQQHTPPTSKGLVALAFAAIYLIWGSTYLAMRVCIETIPPFLMAGLRFLIAGALMYGLLRLAGGVNPSLRQWRNAAFSGVLLLVGGNGLVAYGEKTVNSSLAALLIATAPVWFSLLDWLTPHGSRPSMRTMVGIGVSFIGVAVLIGLPVSASTSGQSVPWFGMGIILFACFCWVGGSMFSKHSEKADSPWMGAAVQMLCGGLALMALSSVLGEWRAVKLDQVSSRSWIALVYLVVFGSWIAFSAYIWLLKVTTPARVSTYAFVNPVIAVFLGWALGGEHITSRTILASAIIVAGVVAITLPLPSRKPAVSRT